MTIPTRYPKATWRGEKLPNVGGALRPAGVLRVVLHVMQGTLEGTDAWFHNKDAEVSAHFGIGKAGQVYQWVELDRVAWAEMNYNDTSWSIEHEGDTGEELTAAQLGASVALTRWLCNLIDTERGLPAGRAARMVRAVSDVGVIGHGELGIAGGNHPECPGAPILAQYALALSKSIAAPVTPEREAHVMTTAPTPDASSVELPPMKAASDTSPAVASPELSFSATQLKVWAAEAVAVAGWVNTFVNGGHLDVTLRSIEAVTASVIGVISHIFNKAKVNRS